MSRVSALTNHFYDWEQRGRGWDVYSYSVELEPKFKPFRFHSYLLDQPIIDDGKKQTLLGSFFDLFKEKSVPEPVRRDDNQLEAIPFKRDTHLVAFSVSLPEGRKVRVEEIEQLLLMLSQTKYHISFEIIGTHSSIWIQFVCREPDAETVINIIKGYYPDAIMRDEDPEDITVDKAQMVVVDFGLNGEFMRPLKTVKNYDLDPYIGIFSILENLKVGERATIQILFQGATSPWSESILRSVLNDEGGAFFLNAPDMVKMAQEKISAPLFGVAIRIIGQSDSEKYDFADSLAISLINTAKSSGNELFMLNQNGYNLEDFEYDVFYRQTHRTGMILNSKELATLIHFPAPSIISKKLERDTGKTKAASDANNDEDHVLGINVHQGQQRALTITAEQRLKHVHIIGATGTGKSTLMLTSIIQDIMNGEGVAVLDPHGDLIDNVLTWIEPEWNRDVILIDPSDSDFPIGFNILNAHSEIERDILSSDLVSAFKRLSTSWGDQMNSVFANAILAFLESNRGGTLVDLRRFLIEKNFRDQILKTVSDPSIVYYWQKEYPILKSSSIGSILTRLDSFLRPKLIRNMVAQNKSLDFQNILDRKKVLLMKLPQGLIGAENSYLLGTFLVSKIQQAAMARQAKKQEDRSDYFLYIDEFQNFITPSMSAILSGARKYHLGLILAHQDMQQLHKEDSELESSIMANAGTRVCFRLGDADAKKFESGFSSFDAMDLQNLKTGEAIVRIERPDNDCNMTTIPVGEMEQERKRYNAETAINNSRSTYGTPKAEVEALFRELHQVQEQAIQKDEPIPKQPVPEPIHKPEPREIKEVELTHTINPEERKQETQHRYLQTLIKKMAESRGYKAITEEPTPDGKGRVDVSLERNGRKIAVEIKETSKDEWELQNIEKCLNAGFEVVIECSTDPKTIERLQQKIDQSFTQEQRDKILILTPDSLFLFLDSEIAKEASTEVRTKGYKVKIEYGAIPESEMVRKRESVAKSVVGSLKDKKK
jgi:hypothetical protein